MIKDDLKKLNPIHENFCPNFVVAREGDKETVDDSDPYDMFCDQQYTRKLSPGNCYCSCTNDGKCHGFCEAKLTEDGLIELKCGWDHRIITVQAISYKLNNK